MTEGTRPAANADCFAGDGLESPGRPVRHGRGMPAPLPPRRPGASHANRVDDDVRDQPPGTAGEHRARLAIWITVAGLAVLALIAWPHLRSAWN